MRGLVVLKHYQAIILITCLKMTSVHFYTSELEYVQQYLKHFFWRAYKIFAKCPVTSLSCYYFMLYTHMVTRVFQMHEQVMWLYWRSVYHSQLLNFYLVYWHMVINKSRVKTQLAFIDVIKSEMWCTYDWIILNNLTFKLQSYRNCLEHYVIYKHPFIHFSLYFLRREIYGGINNYTDE